MVSLMVALSVELMAVVMVSATVALKESETAVWKVEMRVVS